MKNPKYAKIVVFNAKNPKRLGQLRMANCSMFNLKISERTCYKLDFCNYL